MDGVKDGVAVPASGDDMTHEFKHPIIGQEAVVPGYGLGRVTGYEDDFPSQWIEVQPYIAGHRMKFAPSNIRLVPVAGIQVADAADADTAPARAAITDSEAHYFRMLADELERDALKRCHQNFDRVGADFYRSCIRTLRRISGAAATETAGPSA